MKNIISTVNTFNKKQAIEKLYLHTDRVTYTVGDTLRFKGYLLEKTSFHASTQSGILYVEIANDSNRVMKRIMLPLYGGITIGSIALDEKSLPNGGYILRAYTNWMRNFNEAYIFQRSFYIEEATKKDWLISYNTRIIKNAEKDNVQLDLGFNSLDTSPVFMRKMKLILTDGKRTLLRSEAETNMDGHISMNFNLPEKVNSKNLSLGVEDISKAERNRKLLIPLILNLPDRIDLQFMPEGGNLVAGLPARVAFKAVNEDGYGANVSGKIYNSKGQEVAAFNSTHKGIGTFNILPQNGEVYAAKVKLPEGSFKTFPLPVVKGSGITLKVNNPYKADSLDIILDATPDITDADNTYYLLGHARGIVCYGASLRFNNGVAKFSINKNLFPTGIVRFTLTDIDKRALNERMVFIDHGDHLNIKISSSKGVYKQRDSVALNINVSDANGSPVQGSFSLAVTDDTQVKQDSINNGSILTYILLSANLKGTLEDPGYYEYSRTEPSKWDNMDQLLLAQGWNAYDWDEAFAPAKQLTYPAEKEFLIKGNITNAFNKPVPNSGVTLFSKSPALVADTVTNANGTFAFKGIFPIDTAIFFIQAKNKKGKSFNVGIEMEEFKPPVFAALNKRIRPWYLNIDTNNLVMIKRQVGLKENMERLTGGIVLQEVVIKSKRIIKDSKNLNGPGQADIIIDEEELEKAGRTTLGDLLDKRVKGFGYRADKSGNLYYQINGMSAHLIIDGMDTEFFQPEGISLYEHLKQYLDYYDAEEIKGIEVMVKTNHSGRYFQRYINNPMETPWDHAFIEVTTRSGHGPFVKKAVGTYVFRPMPFTIPKQFYAPKYTSTSIPNMTDIRSTIHWEPNIITDKDGKATVTFYTADNPAKYTYIIEGTDLQGSLGVKRGTINVRKTITDKVSKANDDISFK